MHKREGMMWIAVNKEKTQLHYHNWQSFLQQAERLAGKGFQRILVFMFINTPLHDDE